MNIIFQIDGGIGKSVAATAVCKAIKAQYPNDKLIVITGYPEVFLCNPFVDKALNHNNLNYFYSDNIEGKEVKMMVHNPYVETDFIAGNGHLVKIWCEMFGVKYNGEQPEIFLNNREREFFGKSFGSDKPIMVVQTNGGAANQPNKYSWTRDLPMNTAQRIVNAFASDYNIVHIRREDQLPLQNTTPVQMEFRALATLISMSAKRLFIDSFAQHAAAALGKPSVVCWIGNTPDQFGYEMHTNIVAHPPTIKPELRQSVYSKYNISGQPVEFCYNNEDEIFDAERIYQAIKDQPSAPVFKAVEQPVKTKKNEIRSRIMTEAAKNSMVARRLTHLLEKTDLSEVNQILDIGSWHLEQSIEFSNIFPGAKIDAFEPVPGSYELCLTNLNNLDGQRRDRIRVHNIALNNSKEEIPFYPVDSTRQQDIDMGFSSMFKIKEAVFNTPTYQEEIMVLANTLDNWCSENGITQVDIMWIDTQGAELNVFEGATEILKNTKIIMTEVGLKAYYEGHTLKEDIDKFLSDLGFKELENSFEFNIDGYEANTIYIKD